MAIDARTILDPDQLEKMASAVRNLLGAALLERYPSDALEIENGIRFRAVSASCRVERESRGLTVKQLAAQLRIPQYRVKAVEAGTLAELRSSDLKKMIAFFELETWYGLWAAANQALAARFDDDMHESHES